MDQKHVRQYLEGQDGPPMMAGEGSQALFLRDTQQWIRSKEQVRRCILALVVMFLLMS